MNHMKVVLLFTTKLVDFKLLKISSGYIELEAHSSIKKQTEKRNKNKNTHRAFKYNAKVVCSVFIACGTYVLEQNTQPY